MHADAIVGILAEESRRWSARPYDELASQPKIVAYSCERDGTEYQVEVEILKVDPNYVQLMIAVDDCTFWSAFHPATEIVIVRKRG